MPTVYDHLAAATSCLRQRHEAEHLLTHMLGVNSAWLFAHAHDELDAAAAANFTHWVARRADGEPVAYITGHCGFWSLDLEVSAATLIPRPETELLVELALQRVALDGEVYIADLGTGSGALALALASERPQARVLATDASEQALAVAARNAARLGLAQVHFARGDWCQPLAGQRFDVIVSNPPYIALGDAHLEQGDLRYEPTTALSSGSDGLDAIRTLVRGCLPHLVDGGWLLLEHGWDQAEAVRGLLHGAGYADVFSARDLEQRERVSGGRAHVSQT
ncbi:MAG: peptide chain release factor N(5)-glutamine methyltransferase [Xanthomonadales bacterium]|nr:peptide chain release factor N(5)-glutamine methyltransferase [Xanthomonadales bacterium]